MQKSSHILFLQFKSSTSQPKVIGSRSQISCGISNALDGAEDGGLWDDEEEEAEDTEELIDNEFETESEAEGDE